MSDDMQIIISDTQTAKTWDRKGGRKNTDVAIYNRRVELADWMAKGTRFHEIMEWYCPKYDVGEPQLRKDMAKIRKEWKNLLFEKTFEDVFIELVEIVQESIKLASKTNQPSAIQSGVILLNKLLGERERRKNEIDGKEMTIQYEIIDKRDEDDQ